MASSKDACIYHLEQGWAAEKRRHNVSVQRKKDNNHHESKQLQVYLKDNRKVCTARKGKHCTFAEAL